jgi:hypothetical protein
MEAISEVKFPHQTDFLKHPLLTSAQTCRFRPGTTFQAMLKIL